MAARERSSRAAGRSRTISRYEARITNMAELVELPPDVDSDLDVQLPSDVDDDIFPGYHEEGDPPRQEGDPPPLPEDWDSSAEGSLEDLGPHHIQP